MAKVQIAFDISVTLTPDEFRLMGLAMDRKLKGDDVAAARRLGVKLLAERSTAVAEYAQGAAEEAAAATEKEKAAEEKDAAPAV